MLMDRDNSLEMEEIVENRLNLDQKGFQAKKLKSIVVFFLFFKNIGHLWSNSLHC